jgi:GWxTD domain-containing protein
MHAQDLVPKAPLVMNIDYSRFRYTAQEGYVEISYAVYPSLVTLKPEGQMFVGAVNVRTWIRDAQGDSVKAFQEFVWPVKVNDTSSANLRRALVYKQTFALQHGQYFLTVRGTDVRTPLRSDSIRVPLAVDSVGSLTSISDVDLCLSIESSTAKENPFYKNSYAVIPNPSLFFGTTGSPVVFTYAEIYNVELNVPYVIVTEVLDGRGNVLKDRKRPRQFSVRDVVDVGTLNVSTVQSGRYRFVMRITDTAGVERSRTEKPIFIYNPNVPQNIASPTSARAAEMAGMTSDELVEEFRLARYMTTDKDRTLFGQLTSDAAQREFLATFWSEIESGQRGVRDMTRGLYLSRVKTANERFRAMGKTGAQSDRGRIHVLYGEPDEVQRFPSSEGSKPYEIWNYYQIENGVLFAFIDRTGFGDYVLVHSTKRGELQDEGWERYLR